MAVVQQGRYKTRLLVEVDALVVARYNEVAGSIWTFVFKAAVTKARYFDVRIVMGA